MTKSVDTRDSFSNDSLEWKNPDMASADTLRTYCGRRSQARTPSRHDKIMYRWGEGLTSSVALCPKNVFFDTFPEFETVSKTCANNFPHRLGFQNSGRLLCVCVRFDKLVTVCRRGSTNRDKGRTVICFLEEPELVWRWSCQQFPSCKSRSVLSTLPRRRLSSSIFAAAQTWSGSHAACWSSCQRVIPHLPTIL